MNSSISVLENDDSSNEMFDVPLTGEEKYSAGINGLNLFIRIMVIECLCLILGTFAVCVYDSMLFRLALIASCYGL